MATVKQFPIGLVIGKFMPPHHGHRLLITTAMHASKQVTLLVCHQDDDPIPSALRAEWLKKIYPEAEVKVLHVTFPVTDSQGWVDATKALLNESPSAVFTSEDYGDQYADMLGSIHVQVDKARRVVPISASQIRVNPKQYREFLDPMVWEYFSKQ